MFAIEVRTVFSATHALRLPGGEVEESHAHDFDVTVRLACAALDALETVLDFHVVEQWLGEIVGVWRDLNINEIEPFKTRVNPSAERIAEEIGQQIGARLTDQRVRIAEVRVTEAAGCVGIWMG